MVFRRFMAALLCLMIPALPAVAAAAPSDLAVRGFFSSAFSPEYGDTARTVMVRWEDPLLVQVEGDPTWDDLQAVTALFAGLTAQVPGLPPITMAASRDEANIIFSFVPLAQLPQVLDTYVDGNWGFMNCFDDGKVIRYGLVAVSDDVTGQKDRNHLIREEFVNMLGLCGDIDFAPDSIIYQPYTTVPDLAPEDYEMLNLLYSPLLSPGMTAEEARQALLLTSP